MTISLLAVHGNGGGGERFDWMTPHLPEDVHVMAPTLPGFGGTAADPTITDMAGYADFLAGRLEGLPSPVVALGTGIGGSHVLEVLRDHDDLVDAVILHAPVGPRLDTRVIPRVMNKRPVAEIVRRGIATPLLRPLIRRRFFADSTPAERVDPVLAAYAECQSFAQQFQIINAAWWDSLPQRRTPAVVLWGAEEQVLAADMADDVRAVLPEAEVRTIPAWDHFPMIDDPPEYARVVAEAIRDLVGEDR
ncbi:alpha/beta fold hydrolase [Euzebya tangerina]|uniref:alpha/beta fold hydrolase n=1 Tax=Euzebya tangerina TaxID=591198 RepID=UPI000E3219AC|nr:alpha/beta fold hydrolase [Euzebya tangerina]